MISHDPAPLSAEQQAVAFAAPDVRQLVIAPAGTGKTHTLVARLEYLIEGCALSPGQDILVLTFSRAAVREIRDRLRAAGGDVAHVRATTFDSFATRLLSESYPDGSWVDRDYDGRIAAAAEAIQQNPDARELVSLHEHLLIDELQDIVGSRDHLVRALLEQTACGFTLLGDPAQAIYNYQLEGEARTLGSTVLFNWVRDQFSGQLVERTLGENFRAETGSARRALEAASELASPSPDYRRARTILDAVVVELDRLPSLEQLKLLGAGGDGARTAILCRTNGQALVIAQGLSRLGIPNGLQREASDRVVPAWLGRCLSAFEGSALGHEAFLDLYDQRVGERGPAPEDAWVLLARTAGAGRKGLDVPRLAERIRAGRMPDELTDVPSTSLVVSTVHRSKGLEFDTVVVVDPSSAHEGDSAFAEEARILHVAVTRAKRALFLADEPKVIGWLGKNSADRWARHGRKRWQRFGFEVRPNDVDVIEPPGALFLGADPVEVQRILWSDVVAGDPLELRLRLGSNADGEPRAFYGVYHDDRAIGLTSEAFGAALFHELRTGAGKQVRWPVALSDVFLEGVDTVSGVSAAARRAGLGAAGLWLRPRIVGLANLDWSAQAT